MDASHVEDRLIYRVVSDDNVEEVRKHMLQRGNLSKAPGVDGKRQSELPSFLKNDWALIRQEIIDGKYRPLPVRLSERTKPEGGVRCVGVPTVQDRFIMTLLLNVLEPIFDKDFSQSSYGYRKGVPQHNAVKAMLRNVKEGRRWTVTMDLSSFFDRIDHDLLMARVARKVSDRKVLKLLRKYLQCGFLLNGVAEKRNIGAIQGGSVSPLLSNILWDDLDKELERRGHHFARFADDFVIQLTSRKAGERVQKSVTAFLEKKLKLKVNEKKSGVARHWERKFLGYIVSDDDKNPELLVSPSSYRRFDNRVKEIIEEHRKPQVKLRDFITGWYGYYRLAEKTGLFSGIDTTTKESLCRFLGNDWERCFTRHRI